MAHISLMTLQARGKVRRFVQSKFRKDEVNALVAQRHVEENADVPMRYGITALPTLLLLKAGKVAEQRVGLMSKDGLVRLLKENLS